MEFERIVKERYAVKHFDGRKLPEDKIDRLLELIRMAPSSFGIQPWKILIVEDEASKKKLAPAAWNQPQITSCSHLLVFCANTDIKSDIAKLEKEMIKQGANKESIKPYMDMMWNFEKGLSEEQKLSWAQRQLYLALGNALNGAKALGFDSCPMEGFDPKQFSQMLRQPKNIVPTALCAIGYAADSPRPKVRFAKEEIFTEVKA